MSTWQLINIFLPGLLPLAILLSLFLVHLGEKDRARVAPWTSIKDGQLAWVSLGMCLNAMYELQHPFVPLTGAWSEWMLYVLVFMVFLSALVAALGPVLQERSAQRKSILHWIGTHRTFLASTFLALASAFLYNSVHHLTQR